MITFKASKITYYQYGCTGVSNVFECNAIKEGLTLEEATKNRVQELLFDGATIDSVKTVHYRHRGFDLVET